MEDWDREAVYDAEIAPLLARLHELCILHDLPLLACIQYALVGKQGGLATVEHLPDAGVAGNLKVAAALIRGDVKAMVHQLTMQPGERLPLN